MKRALIAAAMLAALWLGVASAQTVVPVPTPQTEVICNPTCTSQPLPAADQTAVVSRPTSVPQSVRQHAGSVTFNAALSQDVVFPGYPLPDGNYRVVYGNLGSTGIALTTTKKTSTGFTVNASLALTGTLDYIALADQ